jgi:hypothetical protein
MASMSKRIVGRGAMAVLLGLAMVVAGCGLTGALRGTDLPKGLQVVGAGFMPKGRSTLSKRPRAR